MTPIMVSMT